MTLTDDATSAAVAADRRQADYFRATLIAQREHLLDVIVKRRALVESGMVERGIDVSDTASQARRAEAEARYIGRLIDKLDHRFPPTGDASI